MYPGPRGVATLTAVDLVRVDTKLVSGLLAQPSHAVAPLAETSWLTDGWESRFLGTHIMQRLGPASWQRILRGMRRMRFDGGEPVVREGEPGDEFYVLSSGHAEVRCGGRCVARLRPGDFFGEDALITGARRNATVTMASAGSVMALDRDMFHSDLLPLALAPGDVSPRCLTTLQIGDLGELRERAERLDRRCAYRVVGGSPGQRALAAFILTQRGLQVGALDDN